MPSTLPDSTDLDPIQVLDLLRKCDIAAASWRGSQHPVAAVLGCADSRVPVELLFDTGFGDLFVVRTAGTMPFTASIEWMGD